MNRNFTKHSFTACYWATQIQIMKRAASLAYSYCFRFVGQCWERESASIQQFVDSASKFWTQNSHWGTSRVVRRRDRRFPRKFRKSCITFIVCSLLRLPFVGHLAESFDRGWFRMLFITSRLFKFSLFKPFYLRTISEMRSRLQRFAVQHYVASLSEQCIYLSDLRVALSVELALSSRGRKAKRRSQLRLDTHVYFFDILPPRYLRIKYFL